MPTPHAEMTYESFAKAAPEANAALLARAKARWTPACRRTCWSW
jgi:hypothetical protein